jgi:hypothetical protein
MLLFLIMPLYAANMEARCHAGRTAGAPDESGQDPINRPSTQNGKTCKFFNISPEYSSIGFLSNHYTPHEKRKSACLPVEPLILFWLPI